MARNPKDLERELRLIRKELADQPESADLHGKMADQHYRAGELDKACAEYQHALELDPESAWLHNNLGNVLCDMGKIKEGIAAYGRALELAPEDEKAEPQVNREIAEGELTLIEERISALEDAGAQPEASNDDRVALGCAGLLRGDYAGAVAELRGVLKKDPGHLAASRNLGFIYTLPTYDAASIKRALKELNAAIQCHPQNARLHIHLGELLAEAGQNDAALNHLTRALELDPSALEAYDMAAALGGGPDQGPFAELVDKLRAIAERAAKEKPDDRDANLHLALAELGAGRFCPPHEAPGLFRSAHERLKNLAERFPDDVDIRFHLADCLFRLGDRQSAFDQAAETAKAHPGHARAVLDHAAALLKQGYTKESVHAFLEVTRLDPMEGPAYHALRFAFEAYRRIRIEETRHARATQHGAGAEAHMALGMAMRAAFRLEEASQAFASAVKEVPQLVEAHVALGQVRLQLRDVDTAEECFRRAAQIDPQHPLPHRMLGELLITHRGNIEEGTQELETYRTLSEQQPT